MQEKGNTPPKIKFPEYAPGGGLILVFLLLALAIHGFLFLLFRPLPQTVVGENNNFNTHTILILTDGKDYARKKELYQLDYALKFLEPGTAILPDMERGFSSVLSTRESRMLLPEILTGNSRKKTSDEVFLLPERKLGELTGKLSSFPREPGKKLSPAKKALSFPLWKLGENTKKSSFLIQDPAAEELLHQYGKFAGKPTIIKVIRGKEFLPPEFRIISSCGAPPLDQLAVRQLAFYTGKNPSLFSGKDTFSASILWRLPTIQFVEESK